MDQDAFRAELVREGFQNLVLVEREPNGSIDDHTHPFEAKALILQGEIRLHTTDGERAYRAADIFHLPANQPHREYYGPEGVTYLVGRR